MTKEAAGQKWPFDKPNGCDRDAARMLALIQLYPMMWLFLSRAKYVELRVDTRDCGFHMRDRDGKPLSCDDVLDAIEKAKEFAGPEVATREYREGSRPEEPMLAEIARLRAALKRIAEDRQSDDQTACVEIALAALDGAPLKSVQGDGNE